MPTDPLTGIPTDWVPLTQYQIPLGTNPALAPEWQPQGRIDNTLYPDNMPSVFATAQAQNLKNPALSQALSTDGRQNLNVNIAAGSLGGGTIAPHWKSFQSEDMSIGDNVLVSYTDGLKTDNAIVYAYFAWANDPTQSQPAFGPDVFMYLANRSGGPPIMHLLDDFALAGNTSGLMPAQRGHAEVVFPEPFYLNTYFPPGDQVTVQIAAAFSGWYTAGIAWI